MVRLLLVFILDFS